MKKFFSLLTIALMLTALVSSMAGCAGAEEDTDPSANTQSEASDEGKHGGVLVSYYSSTGTTEGIAEQIAEYTDAELFEITPQQEYTSEDLDWNNENSRVSTEHDDPDGRNVPLVNTVPDDFDDYDTVFIGYPIWWGIAAWPVDTFVKGNDFSGKTVIPFCTAASSDIGESGELLAEMAGTGSWQQGRRFFGSSSAGDIQSWLDELDY